MKTVIIILGSARSGSTLLAKSIGGHSEGFALGEINRFNNEINNPETHCGCAEKLSSCEFWNDLINDLNNETGCEIRKQDSSFKVGIFKQLTIKKNIRFLIPTILFGKRYKNPEVEIQIKNTFKLYQKIFEKTKSKVLIDSSKSLFRALVLASQKNNNIQFKFIQITRDGRGHLNSKFKSSYNIVGNDGVIKKYNKINKKKSGKVINSWIYINLRNFIVLKLLNGTKSIFVKYEDFTANPGQNMKRIYKFLDLKYEVNALNLGANENHILGGNSSRINAKRIEKQDEKWRTDLDEKILKKFNRRAGWFNKLIGYN